MICLLFNNPLKETVLLSLVYAKQDKPTKPVGDAVGQASNIPVFGEAAKPVIQPIQSAVGSTGDK